jgi:hypothetical protein
MSIITTVVTALTPYAHELGDHIAWLVVKWQRGGKPPLPANYQPPGKEIANDQWQTR